MKRWISDWLQQMMRTYSPLHLFDVRHGESEGNKFKHLAPEQVPKEFRTKPSVYYRLTDAGIERAKIVGQWFATSGYHIDQVFYSPYSRAEETAYHLGIDAPHRLRYELREREYGDDDMPLCDPVAEVARQERIRQRKVDPMWWYTSNGESLVEVMMRYYIMYGTLHRDHSYHNVVNVMHGETMMAHVAQVFRWAPEDLKLAVDAKLPLVDVQNVQINHWSRVNPHNGKHHAHLEWVRVLRPWDPDFRSNWERISRADRSREQLPMLFEQHERFIA